MARTCSLCGTEIAVYPCTHALVTDTQVTMSRQEWERLTAQLNDMISREATLLEIAKWASSQEPYVEEGTYEAAHCPGCGASFGVLGSFDWDKEVAALEHRPDCPVVKARALLQEGEGQ